MQQHSIQHSSEVIPNHDPNMRPAQAAKYLGVGLSSLWLFIKQGRIQKPLKLSTRISVFKSSYIQSLATNGIPEAEQEAKS